MGTDSTAGELGCIPFPEAGPVRWGKRKLQKQKCVFHHQSIILTPKPPPSMPLHSFPRPLWGKSCLLPPSLAGPN